MLQAFNDTRNGMPEGEGAFTDWKLGEGLAGVHAPGRQSYFSDSEHSAQST